PRSATRCSCALERSIGAGGQQAFHTADNENVRRDEAFSCASSAAAADVICPTGALLNFLSQKYSVFPKTQITAISNAVSSHQKGRLAIVTDAGRDAVDAAASGVRRDRRGIAGRIALR